MYSPRPWQLHCFAMFLARSWLGFRLLLAPSLCPCLCLCLWQAHRELRLVGRQPVEPQHLTEVVFADHSALQWLFSCQPMLTVVEEVCGPHPVGRLIVGDGKPVAQQLWCLGCDVPPNSSVVGSPLWPHHLDLTSLVPKCLSALSLSISLLCFLSVSTLCLMSKTKERRIEGLASLVGGYPVLLAPTMSGGGSKENPQHY